MYFIYSLIIFCINNIALPVTRLSKEKVFVFANKEKVEILRINYLNTNSISFTILSTNKITGVKASLSGVARLPNNIVDPEVDVNKRGEPYFVDEFHFGGKCGLTIRIDDDSKMYAKVYESKCLGLKYYAKYKVSFDCRDVMHIVK